MGRRLVGLDIGYLNLRAVALEVTRSGHRLIDSVQVSRFDDLGQRKALSRALNELDSRLPLRGEVVVSSSDLASMVRFEHNDPMPPDRLDRVLRLELSQHAGDNGDVAADAVTVPIDGDELIHCCGLAQPPQVTELLAELKANGIVADRVDLAPAAGVNSMRYQQLSDEEDSAFGLLVDVGARTTRVILCRGRDFLACRQLPIGGDQFTEELARSRDIRFEEAEAIKTGLANAETVGGDGVVISAVQAALNEREAAASGSDVIDVDLSGDTDSDVLSLDDGDKGDVLGLAMDAALQGRGAATERALSSGDPIADDLNAAFHADDDVMGDDEVKGGVQPDLAPAGDAGPDLADTDTSLDLFDDTCADSDRLAIVLEDEVGEIEAVDNGDSDRLELVDSAEDDGFDPDQGLEFETGPQLAVDDGGAGAVQSLAASAPAPRAPEPAPESALKPAAAPQWQRSDGGFSLDEPEVEAPGSRTLMMGGVAMGPELTRAAEGLYAQVAKTVSWFQAQLRTSSLELGWVRLAGGGSDLIGLQPYLRRRFGVEVSNHNPFVALTDRPPLAASSFTLAVGLALGAADKGVRFDLRPESLQRRELFWGSVLWPRVAAGAMVAATVVAAVALSVAHSADQQRFEAYEAQRVEHERLLAEKKKLESQRDGLLTDLKGVASRIFGGRDLLYAIRAFKQEAPTELWITTLDTVDPAVSARRSLTSGASRGSSPTRGTSGRGARGRGARASGTAGTAPGAVREDTLISAVWVDGFMKPDAGRTSTDLYSKYREWYENLLDWQPDENAGPLFSTYQPIWFDDKKESADVEGRYRFEIKFLLRPTSWQEVAHLVGEGER
ncbi:MAG: pilus assembly protein PilM [Planctomycetota bacterium]|jgi:hypothetical protein|nr:pilus assembly protein PilM [Planctomycetota bacterium]